MFRLILVCALSVALTFTDDVAGRCQAEVSFGVQVCACTIRNRLANGWSEGSVLSHYFARSVTPSAASVDIVADVLSGETTCEPVYYLWSRSDLAGIGLPTSDAIVTVCEGGRCVYGFGREALR